MITRKRVAMIAPRVKAPMMRARRGNLLCQGPDLFFIQASYSSSVVLAYETLTGVFGIAT